MSYQVVQIGEVVTLRQGFAINKHTKHHMSDEPTSLYLLRIGDMKEKSFNTYVKDTIPSHFIAKESDIIYTRTGQVGLVFKNQYGVIHNNCFTVTPIDDHLLDREFLYYVLSSPEFYQEANSKATGAAQLDLSHAAFLSITIPLPKKCEQIRIAKTLSSFDKLIDNNQKQIKLLEEAAQRLYKEWFVDLRFPGHETTPIIDGVPEGWSKKSINDVATINEESIKNDYSYEYIDYVDLSSVSIGRVNKHTRYQINNAPGRAKRMAHDGDIIWGMVRPNLKLYSLILHPQNTDVFSTGFAVLSAKKIPFTYLYLVVTQMDFVNYLINCTNGAAYPAVRPEHFGKAQLTIPTPSILNLFHKEIEPLVRLKEVLEKRICQLVEARDRLLPKLMNGEIEV